MSHDCGCIGARLRAGSPVARRGPLVIGRQLRVNKGRQVLPLCKGFITRHPSQWVKSVFGHLLSSPRTGAASFARMATLIDFETRLDITRLQNVSKTPVDSGRLQKTVDDTGVLRSD